MQKNVKCLMSNAEQQHRRTMHGLVRDVRNPRLRMQSKINTIARTHSYKYSVSILEAFVERAHVFIRVRNDRVGMSSRATNRTLRKYTRQRH